MATQGSFIFFASWMELLAELSPEQQVSLLKAIVAYANGGEIPQDLDRECRIVFISIRQDLDRSAEIREARAEAGRQGGVAKASKSSNLKQPQATSSKSSNLKQPLADKDKDKDKDMDMDMDMDMDRESGNTARAPKSPKIEVAPAVLLTEEEMRRLVADYGDADVRQMLDKLSAYKLSTGKTYRSDYMAIRSWVAGEIADQKAKRAAQKARSEKNEKIYNNEKFWK